MFYAEWKMSSSIITSTILISFIIDNYCQAMPIVMFTRNDNNYLRVTVLKVSLQPTMNAAIDQNLN